MKHGPIALIDEHFPTILYCPSADGFSGKNLISKKEIESRRGPVYLFTDIRDIAAPATHIIQFPKGDVLQSVFGCTLASQLLAYHCADFLGKDVDQPRNLAKSVTVE